MTVHNVIRRPVTVIVQGRGLMGFKGDKGDPAPNTIWQFSADYGVTWSTTVPDGVRYMRGKAQITAQLGVRLLSCPPWRR